jgi:hypothetical protein
MTRYATYTGPGIYVEIEGVPMTRGVPIEVPQGKVTALRSNPDVFVGDDPEPPEPAPDPNAPDPTAPEEA